MSHPCARRRLISCSSLCAAIALGLAAPADAFTLKLSSASFTLDPAFNAVGSFNVEIDVQAPLAAGVYNNPILESVVYTVAGTLGSPTPSGFPAFLLERSIGGAAFYAQGSSLSFEIAAGANLSDGLQLSELVGTGTVFRFDGREVDTGRYHPPLLVLGADGSGSIRNSNNFGGINPQTGRFVDVAFGEEYIVGLSTDPASLTLAVPEPSSALLLGLGLLVVPALRRVAAGAGRHRRGRERSGRPTR